MTVARNERISVAEMLAAFLDHAKAHHRRHDGTQTHEVDEYKLVIGYVLALYGESQRLSSDHSP